jgi:ankyrin repeat protein
MARKKVALRPPRPSGSYGQLLYDMWRDPGALQRHLDAGHGIDTPNSEGETLLFMAGSAGLEALSNGSDTLVKQLLQAGADPNSKNREGCTPLMLTSSPDIANYLLDNGAEIESEANDGSSLLTVACATGSLAVFKVLLKRGAAGQLLKVGRNAHTPTSGALNGKHEDVALLLLQRLVLQPGFDIDHPRLAANQPLLCCAAVAGLRAVSEFVLEHGADPDIAGPNGPPLILAVQARNTSIMSLLLQRGANVQVRFGALNSLSEAVYKDDSRMVKLLIRHGADVNVLDAGKRFPVVSQAAALGKLDLAQLLLEAGATLDAVQQLEAISCCCRALDDAAAAKAVKLLLPHCSSFADNNCELGQKMLAHAVSAGKLQAARTLHAAGADVHRTDSDGSTIMHYAAESGSIAVVKWLQSLGLDARALSDELQLPLYRACKCNHVLLAEYLLSLPGAADDVHAVNEKGQTPLHTAAAGAADSVVQLLLQRSADANAEDLYGITPLMPASSLAVVKLLLAAGADAAAVGSNGQSVLHCQAMIGACAGSICLLLKAGADPTATASFDGAAATAASFAGINGNFALETLLSRAADDYFKKHPAVAVRGSSGSHHGSSSSSSSGHSSSAIGAVAEHSVSALAEANSSSDNADAAVAASSTTVSSKSGATIAKTADTINDSDSGTAATHSADSSAEAADVQQQQQQSKQRRAKQACANCSKPTSKRCRRCAAVYYCSIECQKVCFADAQHRAQCEATAAAQTV